MHVLLDNLDLACLQCFFCIKHATMHLKHTYPNHTVPRPNFTLCY